MIKSVIGDGGEVLTEVFNNITSSYELQQETNSEKNVRGHTQDTIKKNNEQYLEKTAAKELISEEATIDVTQPTSPPQIKLTEILTNQANVFKRLKRLKEKKPYDKK